MKKKRAAVAVVGAAETTELGVIPNRSAIGLHADAALFHNVLAGPHPLDMTSLRPKLTSTTSGWPRTAWYPATRGMPSTTLSDSYDPDSDRGKCSASSGAFANDLSIALASTGSRARSWPLRCSNRTEPFRS
jgi:hypothetical protein